MYKLRTEGSFKLIGLTPQRLTRRLAYMTNRFGAHTQYHWQFVIWARLVLLTLSSLTPDIMEAVTRSNYGLPSDQTAGQLEDETVLETQVVWIHAAMALGLLLFFGVWHCGTQPYKWRFQNLIETSLFTSDIFTIGLGVAYTILTQDSEEQTREVSALIIEGLMLCSVAGSLLVALIIVIVRWRTDRRQRMREKAQRKIEEQYRSEAVMGIARENLERYGRHNSKVSIRARASSGRCSGLLTSSLTAASKLRRGTGGGGGLSGAGLGGGGGAGSPRGGMGRGGLGGGASSPDPARNASCLSNSGWGGGGGGSSSRRSKAAALSMISVKAGEPPLHPLGGGGNGSACS